jgi:glycosyltransferase involved in cell wall biosynthesis
VRILLLSNLYPPYVDGGAEILAGEMAAGLERLGHEVLVLTSSHGLPEARQDGNVWRTLQLAPPAHFDRHRPLWRQLDQPYNYYRRYHCRANAQELRRVVAASKPDVLYLWEIAGIGVNSLLRVLPDLKVPVVFHLGSYLLLYAQSPETEQSMLRTRWLKRWLIGTMSTLTWTSLIAVSAAVKEKYVQAGFDSDRIEVIYNGINPRFLEPGQANGSTSREAVKECLRLLYIGRIRAEKGILVAFNALDLLMNGRDGTKAVDLPLHLDVFGDGNDAYLNELQHFLHEKHLTQAVTFHGWIPQDKLIAHYDQSDILLVPSLWQEPFGLVVVEAMARGLPVIASDAGGPAEILTHGVDGLLIEPGNERELASAIRLLLQDTATRSRLSHAARTTVVQRFTLEENTRRVEQHLQRATQGSQGSAHQLSRIQAM